MFLCDFHIHSQYSDGKMTLSELVDMYGERGFGAIAITDHLCETKTFLGQSAAFLGKTLMRSVYEKYIQAIELEAYRALRLYNMVVIPGAEFTKNSFSHGDSAHIVGLGVREFINPDQNVECIIDQIHSQGGVAVAAHPVPTRKVEHQTYHLWHNRDRLSTKIDAWEVASGAVLFDEVYASGLPMLANSDLHHPRQMSSWKTVLDGSRTEKNIFNAIINQNLDFTYYESLTPNWSSAGTVNHLDRHSERSEESMREVQGILTC